MTDQNDSPGQSSLPPFVLEPASPIKKEFQPWHKPRKFFVRRNQWAKVAKLLIEESSSQQINYLTLPGLDLLDVEVMAEACKKAGKVLNFLGFNSKEGTDESFTQAIQSFDTQGKDLPLSERSIVRQYRLEEIVSHNSATERAFKEMGPYHIINLDACNSIAKPQLGELNIRLIDALHRILELQVTHCGHNWLLFITTKFSPSGIDNNVFNRLMDSIQKNAISSQNFRSHVEGFIGLSSKEILASEFTNMPNNESEAFVKKCTLGLSKWIYHQHILDQWQLEVLDSYFYASGNNVNMLSLVIKMHRVPQNIDDKTGIIPQKNVSRTDKFTDIKIVESLGKMKDLDRKLAQNDNLFEKLIIESALQLKQHGYDTGDVNHSKYRKWINNA